jgi:uncharacterized protein
MTGATGDTNLVASGFVGSDPASAPVRFLDAWRAREFTLILSEYLLTELAHTFAKPYFRRYLTAGDAEANIALLRQRAVITPLTVPVEGIATQPKDDLVLATALSGGAQFLVTGDHGLLTLKTYRDLIIVGVHEFLAMLPGLH